MSLRLAILLCLVPFISAWFCVGFIPTSLFHPGNLCVSESAYVGQSLTNRQNGKVGAIKELHGRSERCQDGKTPILATVEYQ